MKTINTDKQMKQEASKIEPEVDLYRQGQLKALQLGVLLKKNKSVTVRTNNGEIVLRDSNEFTYIGKWANTVLTHMISKGVLDSLEDKLYLTALHMIMYSEKIGCITLLCEPFGEPEPPEVNVPPCSYCGGSGGLLIGDNEGIPVYDTCDCIKDRTGKYDVPEELYFDSFDQRGYTPLQVKMMNRNPQDLYLYKRDNTPEEKREPF